MCVPVGMSDAALQRLLLLIGNIPVDGSRGHPMEHVGYSSRAQLAAPSLGFESKDRLWKIMAENGGYPISMSEFLYTAIQFCMLRVGRWLVISDELELHGIKIPGDLSQVKLRNKISLNSPGCQIIINKHPLVSLILQIEFSSLFLRN